ncbi:hypothetical protein [Selenomonas bovis]|mgnify:CR=1 FL=1|uniref:Nmad3 family putative nucleotide modification protein n=1 Tax=Selenomonas bovis TaxID=416586 RepID=UPI00090760F2|nr:hypothetical protein [Selenomonas bovis]
MKAILSRKGMDSRTGKMPSPILPDGALLSLPIPDRKSLNKYGDLCYRGQSFREIITQLNPRFDFAENPTCHLDPDIYSEITSRPPDWKPAFGQWGLPATHLDKLGVDIGDIFLFYGMFQQTKWLEDGKLAYVKGAPVRHIIYGYMQIGEIIRDEKKMKELYSWHPHSQYNDSQNNRLYLPAKYGTFRYAEPLVLTQSEQSNRRVWQLPPFFAEGGISISWQGENVPVMKDGFSVLNSAARGQEFVITADTTTQNKNLSDWAENLIQNGTIETRGYAMERIITEIKNQDLKKKAFTNAQFILMAEYGAMGEPGKILIITSGGSIFHGNYYMGDIDFDRLYRSVPVIKAWNYDDILPENWAYQYLGAGNHLLIRKDVYDDFRKAVGEGTPPEHIYVRWMDAAWDIIEKQNAGKTPLDTKTADELALLADKAIEAAMHEPEMTEEEQLMYDAEHGYAYDEDNDPYGWNDPNNPDNKDE